MSNTTKQCYSCKSIKLLLEFGKQKFRKDGLRSLCKNCQREYNDKYNKTKDGIITKIYGHQRASSKDRGHSLPTYTKQELKDWLMSKPLFHVLYDNWKRLDYQSRYKPSVHRKNDDIGYTMDNIQLITWEENDKLGSDDHKSGKLKYDQKPVMQFNMKGEFIAEYFSQAEAQRTTGAKHISCVCKGKRMSAGGFKWEYA